MTYSTLILFMAYSLIASLPLQAKNGFTTTHWSSPTLLSKEPASRFQNVVVDVSGTTFVLWTDKDNAVFISQASPDGACKTAQLSKEKDSAANDGLAVDNQNNLLALWHSDSESALTYKAAYLANGSTKWKALPNPLPPITEGFIWWAGTICFDDVGNAIVAWGIEQHKEFRLCTTRFDVATHSWTSLKEIKVACIQNINIQFDPAGNALMVWMDGHVPAGPWFINSARLLKDATAWSTPMAASSKQGGFPILAMDKMGNAVAVWTGGAGTLSKGSDKWKRIATPAGSKEFSDNPQGLFIDRAGVATVLWTQYTQSEQTFTTSTLLPGASSWTSSVQIYKGKPVYGDPLLSAVAQGNALASWSQDNKIQGSLKSSNGKWQPFTLSCKGELTGQALSSQGTAAILVQDTGTLQLTVCKDLFIAP